MPLGWSRVIVRGPSMAPALKDGDWLLVRWRTDRLQQGDVVVVELPDRGLSVKRLVRLFPEPSPGIWIEGDNPYGSTDSRTLGRLPVESVRGVVIRRIWPRLGNVPDAV